MLVHAGPSLIITGKVLGNELRRYNIKGADRGREGRTECAEDRTPCVQRLEHVLRNGESRRGAPLCATVFAS